MENNLSVGVEKNLSVRKKKTHMLSYESKFSRHMRNMGNAAEYFMFFKWKSIKKKLGSKIRALFFLLISLIYVEKKIRLLRLTEIPWSFPGKLL